MVTGPRHDAALTMAPATTPINRGNVRPLQLAWAWAMEPGVQEPAMVVHDDALYLPNPGGIVQALDGATADLLWEYRPTVEGPRPMAPVRGLSIYDDKIFVALSNAHLVALDAQTGKVAWDLASAAEGFSFSAPPVLTRGGSSITTPRGVIPRIQHEDLSSLTGHYGIEPTALEEIIRRRAI